MHACINYCVLIIFLENNIKKSYYQNIDHVKYQTEWERSDVEIFSKLI